MSEPRSFAALRQPAFRGFFSAGALAMMADSIEHVISYWILFEKFQSPALAGYAVLAHWLPFLLFSVYSGALADRFGARRMIRIAMLLFMGVSIAWGVLFAADALEVWHAVVLLAVHGLAGVCNAPAQQLLIHEVVDAQALPSAVRLMASARWLGLLLGPAVGAGLLLLSGPTGAILLNALIYIPMLVWLRHAPWQRKSAAPRLRAMADVLATLRALRGNRILLSMVLLAGGTSFLVGNAYHAQMPEFAHDLGQTEADFRYSALLSADAAGALVAAFALESRGLLAPTATRAFALAILWCAAILGFALSGSYLLSVALLFAVGFLELAFNAMAQTLVQLHAPPELRGRVIGVYAMCALGMRTFSGITVGMLGSMVGIHWSLRASAAVLLAGLTAGFLYASRR